MLRFRNYWIYSAGLAIAWAVALILTLTIRGSESAQTTLLVFFGFCIGWVSTTIVNSSEKLPQSATPKVSRGGEFSVGTTECQLKIPQNVCVL